MKTHSEMMEELKKSAKENNLPSVSSIAKIDLESTETLFTADSVADSADSDNQFRETLNKLNRIADEFKNNITFVRPSKDVVISAEISEKLRATRNDLNRFIMLTTSATEPTKVSNQGISYKIGKTRDYTNNPYSHRLLKICEELEIWKPVYQTRSERHPKADFKKKPLERINGKKEIRPSKFLLNMVKKVK